MTCYRFCLHYWSHLGSILVGHTLLIPLVKNKTHYYSFESNLKHTLIKYWPGRMNSLARSISGFPEKKKWFQVMFCRGFRKANPTHSSPHVPSGPIRCKHTSWHTSCLCTFCPHSIRGNHASWCISCPHTSCLHATKHIWYKHRTNRNLF